MRKSIASAATALAVAGGLTFVAPGASAATCTATTAANSGSCDVSVPLTATVTGVTGIRTIGTVAPVALTGATSPVTGPIAIPVVETAALGTNWSVTAAATGLTGGTTGATIANSNLSITSPTGPVGVGCQLLTPACTITAGGGSLGSTLTLLSETGEDVNTAYTGTYNYAGTVNLTVPNGTPLDAYNGTITVTLVQ